MSDMAVNSMGIKHQNQLSGDFENALVQTIVELAEWKVSL